MNHAQLRISKLSLGLMAALAAMPALAQQQDQDATTTTAQRANAASTSNTTNANASQRAVQQLDAIQVRGQDLSLGGGLMSVQVAPKAVSTITREAIEQSTPGANYTQMIDTIPGVVSTTDDPTGLFDGNYQIRGFTNDQIGVTVNGAPVNDSGNYRVYATEYGDTENMNDITVLQGYPDVDQAVAGAAGGTIAWSTIDPSHDFGVDASLSGGSNDYRREFVRVQTGDTGAVRSWISYSHNSTDLWRGEGSGKVDKIDGKSVWTIDDENSISASLQYNREIRYGGYYGPTLAQYEQTGYDFNYNTALTGNPTTDKNYWRTHTNPFRNYMLSLDGEFQLSDSLHLSVVPYFQFGTGGAGSGQTVTESTAASNIGRYGYVNYDVNGDGQISGSQLVYGYSGSDTWRPGVIAKLAQDFGQNDTLTYGIWYDAPRQEQRNVYTRVDADGNPADIWVKNSDNLLTYSNSDQPQYNFYDYTETTLKRAFISNNWTPNDQWTVTVAGAYTDVERKGFGYQHYGADGGPDYTQQYGGYSSDSWKKFTPSAGAKFQLDDANQFYLGYGKTFRAPVNGVITQSNAVIEFYEQNPDELAYSGITNEQLAAIGNNKPESADVLDLGWRYYAGRVSASIDAYAANLKNKQVSGYDQGSSQTVFVSVKELHQRGVNAEASYKLVPEWLNMYASYSYTESTFADDTATIGDGLYPTKGKDFTNVPKNTAHVGLNLHHGPFWASLSGNYRSSFYADWMNTQQLPGYTTFNFNAGVHLHDFASWFKKPQIKVNVYNVTDKQALTYAQNISFLASHTSGLTDPDTGKALYYTDPYYSLLAPRTVMVTLSASFF